MNSKITLLVTAFFIFGHTHVFAENFTGPKLGYVHWGQKKVTVMGNELELRNGDPDPVGVEYYYLFDNGFSIGGEFVYQELRVKEDNTIGSNRGYVNVYRYMGIGKYYFPTDIAVPFVGLGLGWGEFSIHGSENAKLSGPVYAGVAGVDFRLGSRIMLGLEYRNAYLSMKDDFSEMKSRNDEFFIRLSISGGRR